MAPHRHAEACNSCASVDETNRRIKIFDRYDAAQILLPIQHRRQTEPRRAQALHDSISRLVFIRRDDASHVMAQRFRPIFSSRTSSTLINPLGWPSGVITGRRSRPEAALSWSAFSIELSGCTVTILRQRHHDVAHFNAAKIDHVVNHGALRGGERSFALALRRDLFQLLARGKKSSAFGGATRNQKSAQTRADFEYWPKQNRNELQDAGQASQRAKRKAPKQRFRQNAKQEKDKPEARSAEPGKNPIVPNERTNCRVRSKQARECRRRW